VCACKQAKRHIDPLADLSVNVELPGTDTALVDQVLTQLEKHKERLGVVSYATSLPPLAQIFRDIFENSSGQQGAARSVLGGGLLRLCW
jgi:hypothetical protein